MGIGENLLFVEGEGFAGRLSFLPGLEEAEFYRINRILKRLTGWGKWRFWVVTGLVAWT
jgi:hypothetical protein